MRSFVLIALFCAVALSHEYASPEVEFEEAAEADTFAFAETAARLDILLQSGKTANACVATAEQAIKTVCSDVSRDQKMLDKLNNGSQCKNAGRGKVREAERNVARAAEGVKKATKGVSKSESSRVCGTVVSHENSCSAFYQTREWRSAKATVNRRRKELVQAKQKLKDAAESLKRAIEDAKKAKKKCECKTAKETKRELKTAKKSRPQRAQEIIRESMLICLVEARKLKRNQRHAAENRCKKLTLPSKFLKCLELRQTKLAAGVSEKSCNWGFETARGSCGTVFRVFVKGKMTQASGDKACAAKGWKPVCDYKGGAGQYSAGTHHGHRLVGCKLCQKKSGHWHNCGSPTTGISGKFLSAACTTRNDNGANSVTCTASNSNGRCSSGSWASAINGGNNLHILCTG